MPKTRGVWVLLRRGGKAEVEHFHRCARSPRAPVRRFHPQAWRGSCWDGFVLPRCKNTAECCQADPANPTDKCYPLDGGNFPEAYCQPYLGIDKQAVDSNHDGVTDFDQCCNGLTTFRWNQQPNVTLCSKTCRDEPDTCNRNEDCCKQSGRLVFCSENGHCASQEDPR
jgi:hypothetical protein